MKTFFKWLNTNKDRYTSTFYGPFAIHLKETGPVLLIHTEDGWFETPLTRKENQGE